MSRKFEATSARKLLITLIEDYMEKEKITKSDLSRKLDVHRSYITRVFNKETGCTVDTLLGIADAIGLDVRFYRKGIDKKK